ncbi:MAG TPA: TIR domain-containing protein [Rhodanobacteraceae bacterium]|jgi:tetratricopeptide (TPR) repeat protein|nr:TIR domain-containing protein [Rhodanobacteraceae bacterium]
MPDPAVALFSYRAFISYSHRDKVWADWLHKALETYRVPSRLVGTTTAHGTIPRRLIPVFRDRDELASATDLGRKVNEALAQSENLIVICSPAAATSRWVNEEVLAYKRMGRAERIFCLIIDGEPDATDLRGRESEECFCPALRFATDADGRPTNERIEPIAADARPGKDGKANAKLKLIAGMLDVGFDALKQREQHRRMRRMAMVTAAALAVMAVTIVLAIAALFARHEAVIARQAAERRQKQAEGLVDFMLGNLSDKLLAESRLDVMTDVDDHAMAYFKSLPPTDINDTALAQRAKALEKIGTVRTDSGDLRGALEAFHASAAISSALARADPGNTSRWIAYSRTLAYIGMTLWNQGRLGDAQQSFEKARQILQPSLRHNPIGLPLLQQLTYLDNNLDHVLAAQGQPARAAKLAHERLELDERLLKSKPDEIEYASDLGSAHNELGRLALQRGDLATAITEYRDDDAIETRLSLRNATDRSQRQFMLQTHAILGRTLALAGDEASGMHDLQQAVDWATELSKFDPQDTGLRDLIALYSTQLAELQHQNGNGAAASALDSRAIKILTALVKQDPTNDYWQSDYASALTVQAMESSAAGDLASARLQAQAALDILVPMLGKHPDQRDTLLATMTAKLLLASLSNSPDDARSMREQALQTMLAARFDRKDPRLLGLQVEALVDLGRIDEARPLVKQLWIAGYRERGFVETLQRQRIAYPANPAFQQRIAEAVRNSTTAPVQTPQ